MKTTAIQRLTASYYKVNASRLTDSVKPSGAVISARHVARYIEGRYGLSLKEIAEIYNCDNSTILASIKHVGDRLARSEPRYVDAVTAISANLVVDRARTRSAIQRKTENNIDLACPTCGTPVIQELQRQIASLTERLNQMENPTMSVER